MGTGLSVGATTGFLTGFSSIFVPDPTALRFAQYFALPTIAGMSVDLTSDLFARCGKVAIEREVVLRAAEPLSQLHSFYTQNDARFSTRLIRQKHEWIVVETMKQSFISCQKCPSSGDVLLQYHRSMREACDAGLRIAKRPIQTGEIRLQRPDQEFKVANDVQVAYLIAWVRKEDPRWALTTENSRQFCHRLRTAVTDY